MPQLTQIELTTLYNIKQNTVSDILRNKDKWLLVNSDLEEANKQREKNVHFPQVEEALSLWITNALSANLIINGDILRENFLHSNLKLPGFQLLMDGWINLKNVTI